MLGRGIFLSVIMQCLAIFLLLNKVGLKRMSHLVLLAIGNVLLFGFVGNLRVVVPQIPQPILDTLGRLFADRFPLGLHIYHFRHKQYFLQYAIS